MRGLRRIAALLALLLAAALVFTLSPAFTGYHLGYSERDTTCVTRFILQFCKDDQARLAREQATREARRDQQAEAVAAQECRTIGKEAEEDKRELSVGNYYLRCVRPAARRTVVTRREAQERRAQASLEAEATLLKQRAKRLTEQAEQLSHEGKYNLSFEKDEESTGAKEAADKKLKEAQG
jgi:hypothetical protein